MSNSKRRAKQLAARRNERHRAQVQQRRAAAQRVRTVAEHPTRSRRRLAVLGAAVLVVAAVVVVVLVSRDRSGSPAVSGEQMVAEVVNGATGALGTSTSLTAYSITYEVRDFTGTESGSTTTSAAVTTTSGAPGPTVKTHEYRVLRPFGSSFASKQGPPPGLDPDYSQRSVLGLLGQARFGAAEEVTAVAPVTAAGDTRFDRVLDELVTDGTYVMRERRVLLGRQCQVYRTGTPVELRGATAPTETDYSDVCIDSAGLVLEELSFTDGAPVRHRIARDVDESPTFTAGDLTPAGTPKSLADRGAQVDAIDGTTSPVEGYWHFGEPPAGYQHFGRYAIQEHVDAPATGDPSTSSTTLGPVGVATTVAEEPDTVVVTTYADVYVNGNDAIVVTQGPAAAEPSSSASAAEPIDSTLGQVQSATDVDGAVVLVRPAAPADWFVLVSGTIRRAELTSIVGGLTH